MRLVELESNRLWHAQQPLKFGPIELTTRMTVVRLSDDNLWVHSPIALTSGLRTEIDRLGSVHFVVAPNKSHHLFFSAFLAEFPDAEGWVAPGLAMKRPDLAGCRQLGGHEPWEADLTPYFIAGLPLINETVWFHPSTGTLILTDLLFCVGESRSRIVRAAARALGIYGRLGMSRTMKLAVRDRAALAASVAPLLALPVT